MLQSKPDPAPSTDFSMRILDTLNSAVLYLDAERRIVYINAAGEALFESSASSLVGRYFAALLSQLEPSSIIDKLTLDSVAFTEHEAVITLASGKAIVANYSIYPFGDRPEDGEIVLEIRQLERQAQFAQDELKQLQQQATQQLARGLQ
jgi:two-component system nitrogen regulation sensor histidine kinase GlnL